MLGWWPMQLRWAIITYAFIFVLIGTIAGPPPQPSLLRGGQHQSRSAAFLIQLDVPAARGLSRSNRKEQQEQQKEQEQPPFRGGGVQSKAHIYGRPLLILPLQINTSVRGCSLHQKGADIIGADWF